MKKILRMSPWALRNFNEVLEKFSARPIEGLSYLLPILAMIISLICHLINYIKFIMADGYSEQKNQVLNEGNFFDDSSFEYGLQNIQGYIVIGILGISLLFMIIHYYCEELKFRKVTMSICLILLLVAGVLFVPMVNNHIFDKWLLCLSGATLIFVINMFFSESRNAITNMISSICHSYIVIPSFFWLVQNIISVAVLIFVIMIMIFVVKTFFAAGDGTSSQTNHAQSQRESAFEERQRERERDEAIRQENKRQQLEREIRRLEDAIWKHNNHDLGYGNIDVRSCENEIAKLRMRLAQLGK